MGSGLSGYRTMAPLKPQLMVLLVQDIWALVLVVTEPWVLVQLKPDPQPMVLFTVLLVTELRVLSQSPRPLLLQVPAGFYFKPEPRLLVAPAKNHSSTKTDGTPESRAC